MYNLAQVGNLYVYLMIVVMVIGLGLLALKAIDRTLVWAEPETGKRTGRSKGQQPQWLRLAYISAAFLFLSVFSLGVLQTLGVGQENHNHGNSSNFSPVMQPVNYNYGAIIANMDWQLEVMENQLNQMEKIFFADFSHSP